MPSQPKPQPYQADVRSVITNFNAKTPQELHRYCQKNKALLLEYFNTAGAIEELWVSANNVAILQVSIDEMALDFQKAFDKFNYFAWIIQSFHDKKVSDDRIKLFIKATNLYIKPLLTQENIFSIAPYLDRTLLTYWCDWTHTCLMEFIDQYKVVNDSYLWDDVVKDRWPAIATAITETLPGTSKPEQLKKWATVLSKFSTEQYPALLEGLRNKAALMLVPADELTILEFLNKEQFVAIFNSLKAVFRQRAGFAGEVRDLIMKKFPSVADREYIYQSLFTLDASRILGVDETFQASNEEVAEDEIEMNIEKETESPEQFDDAIIVEIHDQGNGDEKTAQIEEIKSESEEESKGSPEAGVSDQEENLEDEGIKNSFKLDEGNVASNNDVANEELAVAQFSNESVRYKIEYAKLRKAELLTVFRSNYIEKYHEWSEVLTHAAQVPDSRTALVLCDIAANLDNHDVTFVWDVNDVKNARQLAFQLYMMPEGQVADFLARREDRFIGMIKSESDMIEILGKLNTTKFVTVINALRDQIRSVIGYVSILKELISYKFQQEAELAEVYNGLLLDVTVFEQAYTDVIGQLRFGFFRRNFVANISEYTLDEKREQIVEHACEDINRRTVDVICAL